MIPAERIAKAIEAGINNQIMFLVGGGIGDRVCAEPVLRYALHQFKHVEFSLGCDTPELFSHLPFHKVFDFKSKFPVAGRHMIIETYPQPHSLINQYISPNLMSTVDYTSLCALRCILPTKAKPLWLSPTAPTHYHAPHAIKNHALIHVGKSWESRTFPSKWWNAVIESFKRSRLVPVLVGNNTIDIDVGDAIDLRDKLTLNDFIWACQNAYAVITNDSSPVHIAASGGAMLAFVPTVRRPDHLLHHRRGGFGWKTMAFYDQPFWELLDSCPNHLSTHGVDKIPIGHKIEDFLPHPKTIVEWISSE